MTLVDHLIDHVFFFFSQMRDARAVAMKFKHVLYPTDNKSLLKDCKQRSCLTRETCLSRSNKSNVFQLFSSFYHDRGPLGAVDSMHFPGRVS